MHSPAEINRTVVAAGFLFETRELADCTLTTRSREDLRRLASSGDEDALAEWFRRQLEEEALKIPEEFEGPIIAAAAELVAA